MADDTMKLVITVDELALIMAGLGAYRLQAERDLNPADPKIDNSETKANAMEALSAIDAFMTKLMAAQTSAGAG